MTLDGHCNRGEHRSGILYRVFHLLRLVQTHQAIKALGLATAPRLQHRVLNHWDNLDGTVERGYAVVSI